MLFQRNNCELLSVDSFRTRAHDARRNQEGVPKAVGRCLVLNRNKPKLTMNRRWLVLLSILLFVTCGARTCSAQATGLQLVDRTNVPPYAAFWYRSEEHTSELQSPYVISY